MGRELLRYVIMFGVFIATVYNDDRFTCSEVSMSISYRTRAVTENCLSCIKFNMNNIRVTGLSCEPSKSGFLITNNLFISFQNLHRVYKAYKILGIPSIEFTIFCSLAPNINKLDMSHISLETIPEHFFCSLVGLLQLDLSYNKITSLNSSLFMYIKKLQTLNLSYNNISTLNDPFGALSDLFEINLSYNKISYISDNLFQNQKFLTKLLLNNNQINKFDYQFQYSFDYPMDSINVSFNRLESFKLVGQVKYLSVSKNLLETLLVNFTSITESIDLSSNELMDIGQYSMLNAINLNNLNLSNNHLSSLPTSSFRNLQQLQILDISNNLLSKSKFGPNDNWLTFFLYLKNLKQASLNNNLWMCSDLKEIYFILKSTAVYIDSGKEHMKPNIHGIACTPTDNNNPINGSFSSFEVNSNLVSELMEKIWKRLENITKLQDLETKVEYQINQSQSAILSKINDLDSNGDKYNLSINTFQEIISKIASKVSELEGKTIYNGPTVEDNRNSKEYQEIRKQLERFKTTLNSQDSEKQQLRENEVIKKEPYDKEIKLLLESINAGANSVSGEVIQNLLLVFILCALCCIIYNVYMLKKNKIITREELCLV
ncbi:leucine-rich repeat protein SHOC-2-like [Euwallacea similis]|uniref:leucine-rich repeat protein SHOC-2-like n=1 Tax=Euwallacea similis TaxID=1736056 RepID=UPI00344BE368